MAAPIPEWLGKCDVLHEHSDGDLTLECAGEKYLATMEGEIFKEVKEAVESGTGGLLIVHILEHEVTGGGRVINPELAKATPCKCFTHEGEEYAWSPGVLGLISSKKTPEQFKEVCAAGCIPAGAGAQARFRKFKAAVQEAHKEWEKKGKGLKGWWEMLGDKFSEAGIML